MLTDFIGPPVPVDHYPDLSPTELRRAALLLKPGVKLGSEVSHFTREMISESLCAKSLAHPKSRPHYPHDVVVREPMPISQARNILSMAPQAT